MDTRARRPINPFSPVLVARLAIVLVSVGAAAVSARVTFGAGGWLWNLDLPKIHYPLASLFHEALSEGRLPLWSDRLGMGFPLYAEGQIGAFYPPNWLIFQLDPLMAMDLTRLLHLALAGAGAGFLALRVTGSRPGSLVAVLIVVLGGAIVTKLEWWNLVAAHGWLPWVLLPLAGRSAPGRRAVAASSIAWGIQALTGHPNTWLLTGLAATILLVRRPLLPSLGRLAAFGLIGGAVGAVQLIPTLLLQGVSVRSLGLSANDLFTSASTPFDVIGLGFVNAFVRSASDGAWDFATTWYPDGIFALLEAGAYVGLPALGLAATGLGPRRARPWIALGMAAVAIGAIAAFRPEWWEAAPLLNGLRSPVRSYLLLSVAIAVLAAIGTSRLGRDASRGRRGVMAMGVVAAAYVLVLVAARSIPAAFDWLLSLSVVDLAPEAAEGTRTRAIAALSSLWPAVIELAVGAVMAIVLVSRRSASGVAACVLLVAGPLALLSPLANPLRPAHEVSYATSSFVTAVAAQSPRRVLTLDPPGYYSGMPDQLAVAGVADVDMFSSLNLLVGDELVRTLRQDDAQGLLRRVVGIDLVVTFNAPCVGRLVAEVPEHGAFLCRVDDALAPPYWIASDAVGTASEADLARVIASHREVELRVDRLTTLELVVDEPEPGWIYVDRAWWFGWRPTVDGREVPALGALGGQLIEVPAGRHSVALQLVPWDAVLGLGLGALGLAGASGWVWVARRRDRSGEPVDGGRPHPPGIDDEAHGQRERGLEADEPADPVRGQEQQEGVEVLRVAVAELRAAGVGVEQHGDEDGGNRGPAADDEPRR